MKAAATASSIVALAALLFQSAAHAQSKSMLDIARDLDGEAQKPAEAAARPPKLLVEIENGIDILNILSPSADSQRIIGVYGSEVSIWDARSGQRSLRWEAPGIRVWAAEFSPDGRLVAT